MTSQVSQKNFRVSVNTDASYHSEAVRQLRDQLVRYTPKDKRQTQVDRAEQLLDELVDETVYPFDFIHYKITGIRLLQPVACTLKGHLWVEDIQNFIEEVSTSFAQDVGQVGERVWTVEELAKRFEVAGRTITRWRQKGLVARRFRILGRVKVGFLDSSVNRFVSKHVEIVQRGSHFRNLDDQERELIFDQVRQSLEQNPEQNMTQIARGIAIQMSRSPETIRTLIKEHDQNHPERALFPDLTGPLPDTIKAQIHNLYGRGVGVAALARQFRRSRQTIHRVLIEIKAIELLKTPIDLIDNPTFSENSISKIILADLPEPETPAKRTRAPKDLPPYLASLYEVPLLSKEQEQHLFRKMNFLKWQSQQLRVKVAEDTTKAKSSDLDRILMLQNEALEVKNQIIRSNLRLVVSIAKRHVGPSSNFFELISDGNMSLMRAVEKFDFSRGNKFSTYASWAIVKNFARSIPEENHHRDRFVTGHEEMFEAAADNRSDEQEIELVHKNLRLTVQGLLSHLDPRERHIIQRRFGLGGTEESTLEALGRELGITKERVRQIESRAQEKIRRLASQEQIELPNT
ncbi:MAG: sigma-70 family RNA polymerase sigma factor [Planctomycetota bacterium]